MAVTRRQHYVWRHYLSAWAVSGQVFSRRLDGLPFRTNPVNLAVERDFYKIPELTRDDEKFVASLIEHSIENAMLKKLALGWLDTFAMPSRLRRALSSRNITDAELERLLTVAEIQSEENLHSQIEADAIPLLDQLRAGAPELWRRDDDARDFAFFIALQHLRTKRMQDTIIAGFEEGRLRDTATSTWPILRVVFATTIGWSLFSDRSAWNLRTLAAGGEIKFITSDQPTINLKPGPGDNDLAFYYPVSPDRAILLEHRDEKSAVSGDDLLTDEAVSTLNARMFTGSHEQVFGLSGEYLASLGEDTKIPN